MDRGGLEWVEKMKKVGIPYAQQEFNDLRSWANQTAPSCDEQEEILEDALKRRLEREPFAYIVGSQPFYHRSFIVTKNVLIPRPETEQLIEHVLSVLNAHTQDSIVDCGTGSGAIAVTLACEIPTLTMIGVDQSESALKTAKENAHRLGAVVDFRCGDLLSPLGKERIDAIVANLPYVPERLRQHLEPELTFEPEQALFALQDGLEIIQRFIQQVKGLHNHPLLWLEILPEQVERVTRLLLTTLGGTVVALPDLSNTIRFLHWKPSV